MQLLMERFASAKHSISAALKNYMEMLTEESTDMSPWRNLS